MSWLSIGSKILTGTFKGGVKATSTLWKGATVTTETGLKAAGAMLKNPKTTVVTGIGAYAGWKMLDEPDKSYGTHVGETVKEAVNGSGDFAHDAINGFTGENTTEQITNTATNTLDNLNQNISETKGVLGTIGDALSGLGNFLSNIFGGGGMNMFSGFFGNIAKGHISGLSIGALIAAGYMIFGRTGLLGKVGGALLAMMMIGSNSRQQEQPQQQVIAQAQEQEQQRGVHR